MNNRQLSARRVVLIGSEGMLGRAWHHRLRSRGIRHTPLSHGELDLTRVDSIKRNVREGARIVVNCAAYTDVEAAERNWSSAIALNAVAVDHLAQRCNEIGATLVHYSTDYVFDGAISEPYRVNAPTAALNWYGRSKAFGEDILRRVTLDIY